MRIELWIVVTVVLLALFTVVMTADEQCGSPVPANVDVPRDLELTLRRLYRRSPTFRAQCERIARARHLQVSLQIDHSIPSRCRAFTIVQRRGYEIRAEIHLPINADLPELVAHEFEHVIEQIEGMNLRKLSRVKGAGVYEIDRELFESDRAQAAGRVVAAEASRRAADWTVLRCGF
jgi:hypothetical protein